MSLVPRFCPECETLRSRLAEAQEEADRRTREVEACYTVQRDLKARLAEAEALLKRADYILDASESAVARSWRTQYNAYLTKK